MSVAYSVRGLLGLFLVCRPLRFRRGSAIAFLVSRFHLSARRSRTSTALDSHRRNPSSACLVVSLARPTVSVTANVCRARVRQFTHQIPVFLSCHPLLRSLALLSLGHPLGAFSCALRDFAALLFRFLPEEISRANTTPARLRPRSGRDFFRLLPKKRRSPLGAGHLATRGAGVSRVRSGQSRFGG
jgi:hypothetical protein